MSKVRKIYFIRLFFRCLVFVFFLYAAYAKPDVFSILQGMRFFDGFSILHLFWLIWVFDMITQLFPIQKHISLGSTKCFRQFFKPIREKIRRKALTEYITAATCSAFWVLLLWAALIALLGLLHAAGLLSDVVLLLISVFFYVCDLICVLIWCPFRLMMKNRCCTTCRIFNWDHIMMFSPLIYVGGFYCTSLLLLSFIVFLVWECCIVLYPERFWEHSNAALQCVNCTDKLCTQYCRKLRR